MSARGVNGKPMNGMMGQVRGWIDRAVTRASAYVDPPLAADARPLEVQGAIVDEIERRAEPIGQGRRALPRPHAVVTVLAPDAESRAALDTALAELRAVTTARLREIRCDVPASFAVSVVHVDTAPDGWAPGQRFAVDFDPHGTNQADAVQRQPILCITIVRGRTSEPGYRFSAPRVLIGRTSDPVDIDGHIRHNQVAFLEEEGDAHAGSVGRAHASIRYDPARRSYQLFDDGSRNGTRVVRDGTPFTVVRSDPVGVTLQSGDELQFGTAAVRVDLEDAGQPA
jgi:hypothetical protein